MIRRALLALIILGSIVVPNTPTVSQRIRTYQDNGQGQATDPNDPRGFIACGSTVTAAVTRVYVDVYFEAKGFTYAGMTAEVLLNGIHDPSLWSLTDNGIRLNFGRSQVAIYNQQLTAPGRWTFIAHVGTTGQAVACDIIKT